VIIKRGTRAGDIDLYVLLLDQVWKETTRSVVDQPPTLPDVVKYLHLQDGVKCCSFLEAERDTVIGSNDLLSWGSGSEEDSVVSLKRFLAVESRDELYRRYKAFREAILKAKRNISSKWWSAEFNTEAFIAIYKKRPEFVKKWCNAVLDDFAKDSSLILRSFGFYQVLCEVLTQEEPQLGYRLWEKLRTARSIRIIDEATGVDRLLSIPFISAATDETISTRNALLDQCVSDLSFLEVGMVACAYRQQQWLRDRINSLLESKVLWRKAKGLTLLCLSDLEDIDFEIATVKADIKGTWVENILPSLKNYIDNNKWARCWYRRFFIASSEEEAFAAYRLFFQCVDRRWWLWQKEMEKSVRVSDKNIEHRLKFIMVNRNRIENKIKKNEKELSKIFLTMKVSDKRVYPFVVQG
jgi:hypothetical protein